MTVNEINLNKVNEQGELDFQVYRFKQSTVEALEEKEVMDKRAESVRIATDMVAALTGEERRELRNELVVLNMPLVTHIITKYGAFNPDKFQNGCIGLLRAAETFNPEKEIPFHNYAAFCIETEIRLAYRKQNRMFESKQKGFLDSLDAPMTMGNGDAVDKYDLAEDEASQMVFDQLIEEAEVDTLFYEIIIPAIEDYGTRGKDIDVEAWRELETQYFLELATVQSQRQRLTFTAMAEKLNSTPQNLRNRHKKVMELIRKYCEDYGFRVGVHGGVYFEESNGRIVRSRNRKEVKAQW